MGERLRARPRLQLWLGLLALGVVLWFIVVKAQVIVEMFWVVTAATLLGLTMRPVADRLAKRGIPRGLTVAGIYLVFVLSIVVAVILIIPLVDDEFAQLQAEAPGAVEELLNGLQEIPVIGAVVPSLPEMTRNVEQDGLTTVSLLASMVTNVGSLIADIAAVLFLGYFVAAQESFANQFLMKWIREQHRTRIERIVSQVGQHLSRWIWSQVLVSVYFGVASLIGLVLLGAPYAVLLSIGGAVIEMIPYMGTLGAILAVIAAATVRPLLALWVGLYYLLIMQLKANIVEPALYGRTLGLHPALTLFVMIVGLKTAGVMGLLFSVPLAVVLVDILGEVQPDMITSEEAAGSETVVP